MDNSREKKFEKIYKEYVKLVYFIISKYVDDLSDREDLTDDVFVDFYVKMDETENVKYYLVTSAKNKSINYLIKHKKTSAVYDEMPETGHEHISENDDGYYETIRDMKKVLSDREIEIIIKRIVYEITFKEIAEQTKTPLKTVYSIYKRAIKKYRKFKGV